MSVLGTIFATDTTAVSDLRNPRYWLSNWASGAISKSGVSVGPDTAMTLSVYYACIRNIAEDVAKVPLKVYRRLTPRGKEATPDHPLYRILHDAPNNESTSITFRSMMTHWYAGWGNGYAEIERDGRGDVVALWPIHPGRCEAKRVDRSITYQVRNDDGVTVVFPQRDILHLRGLGTDLYGYSIARLGCESIARGLAAQEFSARYFGDGFLGAGIFTTPNKMDEQQLDVMRKSWPRGLPSAHNPVFLDDDLKWQSMMANPEESQMIETMKFSITDVARWFRMPLHKIASLDAGARANVETQSREYVTDALMAIYVHWEQEIKRKLVRENEPDVFAEHVLNGILRGESAARATFYKELFGMGAYSPNDIRELENENPIGPDGDTYFIATNNYTPIETAVMAPPPTVPVAAPGVAAPAPPDEGAGNEDDEIEAIKKSHVRSFVDAASRLLRKEALAAGKASGKNGEFVAWANGFYDRLQVEIADVFRAHAEGLFEAIVHHRSGAFAGRIELDGWLSQYATEHRAESMADVMEAHRTGTVKGVCDLWLVDRPGRIATLLTDRIADAAKVYAENQRGSD